MRNAKAVAYYRTSSAANVGADKGSEARQRDAVRSYGRALRMEIVEEFYDPAVSGADPIDIRPGFVALLDYCATNGIGVVLVENASRFARDLAIQLAGHALLKGRGLDLVPVDAPSYFSDPSPTAEMVRQILGAVSQFEKAGLVAKLKHARDRKRAATGRCEGRPPVPDHVVAEARRLFRKNPKTGERRSLRAISAALAERGMLGPKGRPYLPGSVARMIEDANKSRSNIA